MFQTKILTIKKELVFVLVQFGLLLGVVIVAPFFHNQPISGPVVNAMLFISVSLLGVQAAVLIALIPSLVALSIGLLPAVLAPMVPFIMMGNIIMILSFNYLKQKNFWLAIVSSSFLKFIFLFLASSVVINLLLKKEVASAVVAMMSWPQFITALAGGVLAFLILKSIKKI